MINAIEAELQGILDEYTNAQSRAQYDDCSDVIGRFQMNQLNVRCIAAVERCAGRNSIYYRQVVGEPTMYPNTNHNLVGRIGIVQALLYDIQHGYFRSFEDIIHGELFGDFLEMAEHLNNSGYKDAAAVIAGSTLEAHLRQLCKKESIPTEKNGKPQKAETLNTDLAGASVYSKLDQKNVTAWLGLRNKAAHGQYLEYDSNQVGLLISSIRDFITRNPA